MTLLMAPCASVDLDRSVEDREEEAIVREYFNTTPCCTLGPNKSACWTRAGRERFLLARQKSMDLEKKELDLVVLATLPATHAFTNDPCTSREAQLIVSMSGSREVHWIDWSQFFQNFFKLIPSLTTYHHFKVSKAEPGIVIVKQYADFPEESSKKMSVNYHIGDKNQPRSSRQA